MTYMLAGYMWLFIHRPFEYWTMLAEFRVERIYMIATLLFWAIYPKKTWVPNRLNTALVAFLIAVCVAWAASPFMDYGQKTIEDVFKIAVFYFLLVTTVRDEESLKRIVGLYLCAVSLYMLHSFREYFNGRHVYRMGFARMIGIDITFGDPNTFAATILYSLPLVLPFWMMHHQRWVRGLLLGYVGLSTTCILLTGSRTGFVGLLAFAGILVWYSKRRFIALMLLIAVGPMSWVVLPADIQSRFLTIFDADYGQENAAISARSRWEYFKDSLDLLEKHPATGVGPGAFGTAAGHGQQAHTLYGQILGELGILGMITFASVILALAMNAFEIRQAYPPEVPHDFIFYLTRSLSVVFILLLVMGLGGHNLYRYTWAWFGAFQAIALHCIRLRYQPYDGLFAGGGFR